MYTDAPFDAHVNPFLQFDGAFSGHVPAISLKVVWGQNFRSSVTIERLTRPPSRAGKCVGPGVTST